MTDKEWMQLELNRMVKAEGGKVSVERMTEIVSELNERLRENPNLPREVNTLTADELIARARKKKGEERYRIIKRVLRMEPDNITAACMQIEYLAKNADDRVHHYEDLTRKATARLTEEGLFAEESAYDHYQELGKRSAGGTSDYQAGTTKDGNEYFSYTVNGNEWDYFIKVKDSHTVIVLTNTVSQESAQEAFEQLSLSLDK